ncbi:NADH:flavin oxidoreductase/NADH oxidase family protein [Nocardia sp. NPDC058518]|uniref:NADH:flavin oxidoreductase/NADH oxidase family protein n=1 Tax=Nocardia sp. NPDC058518 TaxID=3346534 RepID=UPI003650AD71
MSNTTAALADSIALPCGAALANRIVKSALSEGLADAGNAPTPALERLYRRWADGGFGLVVTGNVMVDRRHLGEPGNLVVEDDRHMAGLRRLAGAFDHVDTACWVQLNHPGRQSNPLARTRPVAPSAIAADVPGASRPTALTGPQIEEIITRFAESAAVCEAAGFAGVQIHAAHGYLITQFLSPLTNRRDDEWGGDPVRRRRFLLEVVRAIRDRVSPEFAVGVKLNSADFQRGGFTEDESRDVVSALVTEGIDLLEISGGSYESPAMLGPVRASTAAREAYFLDYARTVAELAGPVPVAVTGGFRTVTAMHDAVSSGDCDLIGLGRPTCLDPDAATTVLRQPHSRLAVGEVRVPFASTPMMRQLQSLVELQWHTDQLHRLGNGKTPDPDRAWWQTAMSTMWRNGADSLRPKRGGGAR